jgi:hypothetical protein
MVCTVGNLQDDSGLSRLWMVDIIRFSIMRFALALSPGSTLALGWPTPFRLPFFSVDPSKVGIAFQATDEDESLQSPLSSTATASPGGGMSDPIPPPPFVVTEALSKVYYKGLPSEPPLIATTKPGLFEYPTGPEAYSVLKEFRELGDHPLATVWDDGLAERLRRGLNKMRVNWTSIDAVRIVEVGESSGPAIVWIGVEFGALSFDEGSVVAHSCQNFINNYHIHDYYVEIRASRVMRQAGNRFFDPVLLSDLTFTARDTYTATLGIPISAKDRPWAEGTGGFYIMRRWRRQSHLPRHCPARCPSPRQGRQHPYERKNDSKAREDVVVPGISGFNEKLEAIDRDIRGQESAITDAKKRIESVKGQVDHESVTERQEAEKDLKKAQKGLEGLNALRHEIATRWREKEKRVFGELVWAPPIVLSTDPGQFTLALAVIKIDAGKLDANNYRGSTINIGTKYTRQEFMDRVCLRHTTPTSFKFPANRLVTLRDQVPESALVRPPMLDNMNDPCLVVFKNGAKTGTTIGKANNVSSYTRNYFAGQYQESREWAVIPTDRHSGAFSTKGDSGSCVADVYQGIGGILTGGAGATESSDVTYITPISFIMKILHDSKRFQYAHSNPDLA